MIRKLLLNAYIHILISGNKALYKRVFFINCIWTILFFYYYYFFIIIEKKFFSSDNQIIFEISLRVQLEFLVFQKRLVKNINCVYMITPVCDWQIFHRLFDYIKKNFWSSIAFAIQLLFLNTFPDKEGKNLYDWFLIIIHVL